MDAINNYVLSEQSTSLQVTVQFNVPSGHNTIVILLQNLDIDIDHNIMVTLFMGVSGVGSTGAPGAGAPGAGAPMKFPNNNTTSYHDSTSTYSS